MHPWNPSPRDGGADAVSTPDGQPGDAFNDVAADSASDATSNAPPSATMKASPWAGVAPLPVAFDGSASSDSDGTITAWSWDFGDGAKGSGKTAQHSYAATGCFTATLTVTDDRGATGTAQDTVVVTSAAPGTAPVAAFEALPSEMAVIPRDPKTNQGEIAVRGTVSTPGYHAVVVELTEGASVESTVKVPLCESLGAFPFEAMLSLPAGLKSRALRVSVAEADKLTLVAQVQDLVAGDILLVQGQSNAVAAMISGDANVNQSPFIRSFGTRTEDGAASAADQAWHPAEGNSNEGAGSVGQWTLKMARMLVESRQIPLGILNGARGGQPISYFQRDDAFPTNPATNYGRLLQRARAAGVDQAAIAILYYQGESDGANALGHHDGWIALHEDWLQDFPSVQRTYVTQIRLGCGDPSMQTLEVQRHFADEIPAVSVMSTTGLDGHDGCHFAYGEGYEELGTRYAGLLLRDLFGGQASPDIDAPNPKRAFFSKADQTEITVEMRDASSTLAWGAGAEANFSLVGSQAVVSAGSASGSKVVLTLSASGAGATGLTYTGHTGPGPWVTNARGIGLLAFDALPVDPS